MMAFAETRSSRSSLRDPSSAQYQAVEWLAQDKVDHGSNWSGYELLQRYVLRVLYHSTDDVNWKSTVTSSLFDGSSVCDWGSNNVQCNGAGGQQVDYIFLDNAGLEGTIPPELGLLTALTLLDLDVSRLSGTIPSELGGLTRLTKLSLVSNRLVGTIPSQLGQLTLLITLSLWANQLTGAIPNALAQLTRLDILELDRNNLIGKVPPGFCFSPFPNWRASTFDGNSLRADCMSEVICDCCDFCYDAIGRQFCWDGSGFTDDIFSC